MINRWFVFLFKGRQKLARFTGPEFTTLIIDILNDARRRELSSCGKSTAGLHCIYVIWCSINIYEILRSCIVLFR